MNPASYEWAKSFLSSPAWAYFSNPGPSNFLFSLPNKCPVSKSATCLTSSADAASSLAEDMLTAQLENDSLITQPGTTTPISPQTTPSNSSEQLKNISPSTGPWSKALLAKAGKLQLSEDDPSIRRSCRQKLQKKGFKNCTCTDRSCIACDSKPPTMSPSIIKNPGATLCKVEVDNLEQVTQPTRKKPPVPVGKRIPPPKKQPADDNDKATKKKPKK